MNNIINLSEQISWDKANYIWTLFFEKINNKVDSDENKQKFSSLISDTLFTHITGKNPWEKLKKVTNSKKTKYSQHIIQSIWFYILLKHNKTKSIIENKQEAENLINNFLSEIANYNEIQLKNLFKNVFSTTKKLYDDLLLNYCNLSNINSITNQEIHKEIEINKQNFHDIINNRTNIWYLPRILQYFMYAKLNLNSTNSNLLSCIYTDRKIAKSNFSIFTELFKLRNTFKSIDEIYKYFESYFEENKNQKIIDFYRYYNPDNESYQNSMYLATEKDELNFDNIFFQWFIENKNNIYKELNIIQEKESKLNINNVFDEINTLLDIFWDKLEKNKISINTNWTNTTNKIFNHLFEINEWFFNINELNEIYRNLEKIPNNFSWIEAKDTYINIELLENWITFKYCYKPTKDFDFYIAINQSTFISDTNWNILISENNNELLTEILYYINWNINIELNTESKEVLSYLILNWILKTLVSFQYLNNNNNRLALLMNSFNVIEKNDISENKEEQNIFPLKNIKPKMEIRLLEQLFIRKKDEIFIWKQKIDLPVINNIKDSKTALEKISYVKNNKLEVTKNIFLDILKNWEIKSFSKLTSFLEANANTLKLLKENEKYYNEVKKEINKLIAELDLHNWKLKVWWNYSIMINKIFKLYIISQKYDLNLNKNKVKRFLDRININNIIRYLWIVEIEEQDLYILLVEYLNTNIWKKVQNLLDIKDLIDAKIASRNYVNIYDKIESIFETLLLYNSVITNKNRETFKKIVAHSINKHIIEHFEKILDYWVKEPFDSNYQENEFYTMFYTVKRLIWLISIKIKINTIDFSFFNSNERIKKYNYQDYISKSKRKRLENKNKDLLKQINQEDENEEEIDDDKEFDTKNNKKSIHISYKSIKDIYTTVDNYIETTSTKINVLNHLEEINSTTTINDIEEFLKENKDIVYFFETTRLKAEFIVYYINELKSLNIDLFESEIIKDFLLKNFDVLDINKLKNLTLNYLYQLWFSEYVYQKETWNNITLSKKHIHFIEEYIKKNHEIYEIIKNYILFHSREIHNIEINKL